MRLTTDDGPSWGDAADLIALLDVQPDGEGSWIGMARSGHGRSVVEGSQMLGQAIVAAGRHAPGRRVVSAHGVHACRRHRRPVRLRSRRAERTVGRSRRSPCAVEQEGDLRERHAPARRHGAGRRSAMALPRPTYAGPDESEPSTCRSPAATSASSTAAYTDDPDAPVGPPVLDAWVRFRDVPDDPLLHAAVLAQFTGHMSIAAALRPHAGSARRRPTARCRPRSTPSALVPRARSAPTAGCCTTTSRRSPVTA